jgi:hypothetical protein
MCSWTNVTARVPVEEAEAARREAARRGLSVSMFLRQWIRQAPLQDIPDNGLAEQAPAPYTANRPA